MLTLSPEVRVTGDVNLAELMRMPVLFALLERKMFAIGPQPPPAAEKLTI